MKNKEIVSKQHENKQKVFHTTKVNNEKAIENSELKINVDEQHVDMKPLKEQERTRPLRCNINTQSLYMLYFILYTQYSILIHYKPYVIQHTSYTIHHSPYTIH